MVRSYVKTGKYRRKPPNSADKLLPMPLAPILLCQPLIVAAGAVYRDVVCLAIAYWLSGCRDLPTDNSGIAALVRAPVANVIPIRSAIDAALADLLPTLKAEYERRHETRQAQAAIARYANSMSVAARARKKQQAANDLPSARIQPIKAAPFRPDGRTDATARQSSVDREERAQRQSTVDSANPHRAPSRVMHGLLSDGPASGRK